MKTAANYYVYAYYDPRNYELFYIGKGQGSRKEAHLHDRTDSAKVHRIDEIRRAGEQPIIRVLATNLTEDQAYLVEKALIWRSGKSLINLSGGKFADNFRPPNTLHLALPNFDTARGVFFVNVGGHFGPHRQWEDCYKYNFVAAGYGREHSSQLDRLSVGDIVAAYLSKKGYVGIGRVVALPVPSKDFRFNRRHLTARMLKGPDLLHHEDDAEKCEYLVGIKSIKKVHEGNARFRKMAGLFAKQPIVASLSHQPKTLEFLQNEFNVNFEQLLSDN